MPDCCSAGAQLVNTPGEPTACAYCGKGGKAVSILTLKSLLVPEAMKRLDPAASYYFCRTMDCPVVYFSRTESFTKSEVTVRVFQKEHDDPLPVCYCFGFTRAEILDEVVHTGHSTALQEIKRYIQEGKCACEIRNPQGGCCLGNVAQIVKEARQQSSPRGSPSG